MVVFCVLMGSSFIIFFLSQYLSIDFEEGMSESKIHHVYMKYNLKIERQRQETEGRENGSFDSSLVLHVIIKMHTLHLRLYVSCRKNFAVCIGIHGSVIG